jgi:hypothetical protein
MDWLNEYANLLLAFFTLVLAGATVGLWRATTKYRKATERYANVTEKQFAVEALNSLEDLYGKLFRGTEPTGAVRRAVTGVEINQPFSETEVEQIGIWWMKEYRRLRELLHEEFPLASGEKSSK